MTQQTPPVAPPRVGDGSREFLFAWVFFGAGLFAAAASAWGAALAGPFSSLCLVIGFVFLAAGLSKRLAWQLEQRMIDIEAALKQAPAPQPQLQAELRPQPEPPLAIPAEERAIGRGPPVAASVDPPAGRA